MNHHSFVVIIVIIISLTGNAISMPCSFNYVINAKLVPDEELVTGNCWVKYDVTDSSLSREVAIYSPDKPNGSNQYLSLTVPYDEDPIRERTLSSWIEISRMVIDGTEYDLSKARREQDFLRIKFASLKRLGSTVEIFMQFKTHYIDVKNNLFFTLWYPYLSPSNYMELWSLPNNFNVTIEIPEDFRLLANSDIVDSLGQSKSGGNYITYKLKSSHLSELYWIASPGLRLIYSSKEPFTWGIWSDKDNLSRETIEALEKQLNEYVRLFGMPCIDKRGSLAELTLCIIPLQKYMGGGSTGKLIVLNKNYFKWYPFRVIYPVIPHELLHFWWINHDNGVYTKKDAIFVEAFTDHMIDFFKDYVITEKHGRLLGWLKRNASDYSLNEYRLLARSGYHVSVFPVSTEQYYRPSSVNLDVQLLEEKGKILLDALSRRFSREEWQERILAFYKETRDRAMTFEHFCELNPDIQGILREWFSINGDFDYALGKIMFERNGDYKTTIQIIKNGGLSSPDLEVLIGFDDETSLLDTVKADIEETKIEVVSKRKVKRVIIDPERKVPDYDRTNNRNFNSLKLDVFPIYSSPDNLDSYKISFQLLPIPLPSYSDENGFSIGSTLLHLNGLTRSFGCAGRVEDNNLIVNYGYNFKASEWIWDVSYDRPFSISKTYGYLAVDCLSDPERFSISAKPVFIKVPNWDHPPVSTFSIYPKIIRLRRPGYRNSQDWAEGDIVSLNAHYKRKDVVSFTRKVKGYTFYLSGEKAFATLGPDWDYEKLIFQAEFYSPLCTNIITANRIFAGRIRGEAPLQEQFDLTRDGLFLDLPMYYYSGNMLFSLNTELRLEKLIPVFDMAIYLRYSWMRRTHSDQYKEYSEVGLSIRCLKLFIFNIGMWNNIPDLADKGRRFTLTFVIGSPFKYSPMRWYR